MFSSDNPGIDTERLEAYIHFNSFSKQEVGPGHGNVF